VIKTSDEGESFAINRISSGFSKGYCSESSSILRTSRAINRADSSLTNKPENKQFKAKLDLLEPLPPYCPEGRVLPACLANPASQ
jgi:hypothetical protein